MKLLHIAAHLGGGAGKAISGIAIQGREDFPDEHQILLLQRPEKDGYVRECQENGVPVSVWNGDTTPLKWADVIVVSWWNHPVMARFLRNFPAISPPVILWSHVNGCHYPMLPYPFVDTFDGILFTSPYSLENPTWTRVEREVIKKRCEIVWGMGRFTPEQIMSKTDYQNRETFTIGYAGTLNYGKLHPKFVTYCKAVCEKLPAARFVMAGDRDEALEQDVRLAGLEDRFVFPGYVVDVPALMRRFDAFGYLLNPEHYGTTENVLLEAMACGLPVVALDQNVEHFIISPEVGYLVQTPGDYATYMEALWQKPALREQLGRGARAHVLAHYNAADNTARFRNACLRAAAGPGGVHDFSLMGASPWNWFLLCLDEKNRHLMTQALQARGQSTAHLLRGCSPILWEERKSSLRHFAAVYDGCEKLCKIASVMKQQADRNSLHSLKQEV